MAPMSRYFCSNNTPNEQVVDYYRRRAEGGIGLIITEGACIDHPAANGYKDVPFIYGEKPLNGWKKVVDAVHDSETKIFSQLWHVGAFRNMEVSFNQKSPAYSPSGIFSLGKKNGIAMSMKDIDTVITAYAQAALDAKQVGFDGIEIHAGHGYLIDQFFWKDTNTRRDSFGGSIKNRTQFATEIIQAIKQAAGKTFPISLRWSQWKQQDYKARLALTPAELEQFLSPLASAGVDMFHCSTRHALTAEFTDSTLSLAGWTKKITGKPTVAVGNIGIDFDGKDGQFKSAYSTLLEIDE